MDSTGEATGMVTLVKAGHRLVGEGEVHLGLAATPFAHHAPYLQS